MSIGASQTQLPSELIQQILSELWLSPITREERVDIFQSLTLVNDTWLAIFLRVALTDVHILSQAFADKYIHIIHTRSGFEKDIEYLQPGLSGIANTVCRSMTFYVRSLGSAIDQMSVPPSALEEHSGNTIDFTLSMIRILRAVPNLRVMSMKYYNVQFNDILDCRRLLDMPTQVTELELRFGYSDNVACLSEPDKHNLWPRRIWALPSIKRLVIFGAPATLVSDLLETCPNTELLEVGDVVGREHINLTPEVKTFVCRLTPANITYTFNTSNNS